MVEHEGKMEGEGEMAVSMSEDRGINYERGLFLGILVGVIAYAWIETQASIRSRGWEKEWWWL